MTIAIDTPVLSSPILWAQGSVEGRGSGSALAQTPRRGSGGCWRRGKEGTVVGRAGVAQDRGRTGIRPRARLQGAAHLLVRDFKPTATL